MKRLQADKINLGPSRIKGQPLEKSIGQNNKRRWTGWFANAPLGFEPASPSG